MGLGTYRNRVRVRTNGMLVRDEALLLVKIHSPALDELVWMPPGGGVEFGESLEASLEREFREETGVEIDVGRLRFVNEFIHPPYHAIEFYFDVYGRQGKPVRGRDPEHDDEEQVIEELRYIPFGELGEYPVTPGYLADGFPEDYRTGTGQIRYALTRDR